MHPTVALYNGFYCLDGYCGNGRLDYKNEFGKISRAELDSDPILHAFFKYWGNRCYIVAEELGPEFMWTKDLKKSISGISLNLEEFQKMGGAYILSAVEIKNPERSGLALLSVFEHSESAWIIYLYEPLEKVSD